MRVEEVVKVAEYLCFKEEIDEISKAKNEEELQEKQTQFFHKKLGGNTNFSFFEKLEIELIMSLTVDSDYSNCKNFFSQ